ncbi:hypothetical protein ANN_00741 [Periplaneta americana]|uniref:Uncharacterized protein n=1 Tax=Periplaneta americana TaxID=6978 RepID=A0ABQ8TU16_PERAM|nr:hypothetical protein ANN_00741 [Periplaneta americana]
MWRPIETLFLRTHKKNESSDAVKISGKKEFGEQWIGCSGSIGWSALSPDLTPLDFCVWGHLKSLVYETPIESEDELIAQVLAAADSLQHMPEVFECLGISCRSLQRIFHSDLHLFLYKITVMRKFTTRDKKHKLQFVSWLIAEEVMFHNTLFSDKAYFI